MLAMLSSYAMPGTEPPYAAMQWERMMLAAYAAMQTGASGVSEGLSSYDIPVTGIASGAMKCSTGAVYDAMLSC
eukprot:449483-Rhodomonas_salina.1